MSSLWLDFEKPVVELETKIKELREFATSSNIEVGEEVVRLERRAERLRRDIYTKLTRWQRIVLEAARQSGRPLIPKVALAGGLEDVLRISDHSVKLLLWEEERDNPLKETLAGLPLPETVALIVGPEGGLSADEAARARECGFIPVSLGKRIVRTETASLVMLAILQFNWGDLG